MRQIQASSFGPLMSLVIIAAASAGIPLAFDGSQGVGYKVGTDFGWTMNFTTRKEEQESGGSGGIFEQAAVFFSKMHDTVAMWRDGSTVAFQMFEDAAKGAEGSTHKDLHDSGPLFKSVQSGAKNLGLSIDVTGGGTPTDMKSGSYLIKATQMGSSDGPRPIAPEFGGQVSQFHESPDPFPR